MAASTGRCGRRGAVRQRLRAARPPAASRGPRALPRHLASVPQPLWIALCARLPARVRAEEPRSRPPGAVFVLGAAGFSAELGGEYVRAVGGRDGRPWYQKRDGSKHLFYDARQREWQLARRPGRGGLFASCRGADAADPTRLRSRWVIGASSGAELRVEASPAPGALLVAGDGAAAAGVDGEYCLLPAGEDSPREGEELGEASRTAEYGRAGPAGCSGQTAEHEPVGAQGADVRLLYSGGAWSFVAGFCGEQGECRIVASCSAPLLRPDLLPDSCFGRGFSVAGVCPEAVPVVVEVGGPVQGAAARVRGEYHRGGDFDGRPSFAKPDGSMLLFYSDHLGGWQLSGTLGRSEGLWHPDVRACSPDQLEGPWQTIDERHGEVQPLPLAVREHPLPARVTFVGWPSSLRRLSGPYELLPGKLGGRPAYRRGHASNTTAVFVAYDSALGEWIVSQGLGRRKLAAAAAPGAHRPDRVGEWHLLRCGACLPRPELRVLVARPGPGAVLVSGRGGRISSAVNGEYARTPHDLHGRASYAKPDGSKHLFFSQRDAEWQIAGSPEDSSGVLAFCPDAHARDPSRLSRPWVVGVAEDRAVTASAAPAAGRLRVRSGGALLEGEFRLVGQLHHRPVYSLASGAARSRALPGHGPLLLCFSARDAVWALVEPPLEGGRTLARARGAAAGAYRAQDIRALWDVASQPGRGGVEVWIEVVAEGSGRVHVKAGGGSPPVADGAYERTGDVDARPAYQRLGSGEPLRLLYSNEHGDWRIVRGPPPGVASAVAFCADVHAARPEMLNGTWFISEGTSNPVEGILAITSGCRRLHCDGAVLALSMLLAAFLSVLRIGR